MLCDDFVEFGSSGRVFDKRSIVVALSSEPPLLHTISEFKLVALAADVASLTYRLSLRTAPDRLLALFNVAKNARRMENGL